MTKSTEEVMRKAVELKPEFVEWMRRNLGTFGDVVDQLRVFGHMCQAGVDLAQHELDQIKLQEEQEKSKLVLAS